MSVSTGDTAIQDSWAGHTVPPRVADWAVLQDEMSFMYLEKVSIGLLSLALWTSAAQAQAPLPRQRPRIAPATNITVDGNEAMFSAMCALYASGFESDVSTDNWSAFRAQMRDRLRKQQGPAVDAVRQFYHQHDSRDTAEILSRYLC